MDYDIILCHACLETMCFCLNVTMRFKVFSLVVELLRIVQFLRSYSIVPWEIPYIWGLSGIVAHFRVTEDCPTDCSQARQPARSLEAVRALPGYLLWSGYAVDTSSRLRGRECPYSQQCRAGGRGRQGGQEALHTQLDALRVEKQRLEAENAKLSDGNPEGATHLDRETEAKQLLEEKQHAHQDMECLRELYEQALRDLQERNGEALSWQQKPATLQEQVGEKAGSLEEVYEE